MTLPMLLLSALDLRTVRARPTHLAPLQLCASPWNGPRPCSRRCGARRVAPSRARPVSARAPRLGYQHITGPGAAAKSLGYKLDSREPIPA